MGGCSGPQWPLCPMPGQWLLAGHHTGHVYTFGDAPYFGAPGPLSVPVTSVVRTPDGNGYWILFANGTLDNYGDAGNVGSPAGSSAA